MEYNDIDTLFSQRPVAEIREALLETYKRAKSAGNLLSRALSEGADELLSSQRLSVAQSSALDRAISALTYLIDVARQEAAPERIEGSSPPDGPGNGKDTARYLVYSLVMDAERHVCASYEQSLLAYGASPRLLAAALASSSISQRTWRRGSWPSILNPAHGRVVAALSALLGSTTRNFHQDWRASGRTESLWCRQPAEAVMQLASAAVIDTTGTGSAAAISCIAKQFHKIAESAISAASLGENRRGEQSTAPLGGVRAACEAWRAAAVLLAAPCVQLDMHALHNGDQSLFSWSVLELEQAACTLLAQGWEAGHVHGQGKTGMPQPIREVCSAATGGKMGQSSSASDEVGVSESNGSGGLANTALVQVAAQCSSRRKAAGQLPEICRQTARELCLSIRAAVRRSIEGRLRALCVGYGAAASHGGAALQGTNGLGEGGDQRGEASELWPVLDAMVAVEPLVALAGGSRDGAGVESSRGDADRAFADCVGALATAHMKQALAATGCTTRAHAESRDELTTVAASGAGHSESKQPEEGDSEQGNAAQRGPTVGLVPAEQQGNPVPSRDEAAVAAVALLGCEKEGNPSGWIAPALAKHASALVESDIGRLRSLVAAVVRRICCDSSVDGAASDDLHGAHHSNSGAPKKVYKRIYLKLCGAPLSSSPGSTVQPGPAQDSTPRRVPRWQAAQSAGQHLAEVLSAGTSTLHSLLRVIKGYGAGGGAGSRAVVPGALLHAAGAQLQEAVRARVRAMKGGLRRAGETAAIAAKELLNLSVVCSQVAGLDCWQLAGDGAPVVSSRTSPGEGRQGLVTAAASAVFGWADGVAAGLADRWLDRASGRALHAPDEAWCFGRQGGLPWLLVEEGGGLGDGSEDAGGEDGEDEEEGGFGAMVPCGVLPETAELLRGVQQAARGLCDAMGASGGTRGGTMASTGQGAGEAAAVAAAGVLGLRAAVDRHAAARIESLANRDECFRSSRRQAAADAGLESDVFGTVPAGSIPGAHPPASDAALRQLAFDAGVLGLVLGGGRGRSGAGAVSDLWAGQGSWEPSRLRAAAASLASSGTVAGAGVSAVIRSVASATGAQAGTRGLAGAGPGTSRGPGEGAATGVSAGEALVLALRVAGSLGEASRPGNNGGPLDAALAWAGIGAAGAPSDASGSGVGSCAAAEAALVDLLDPVDWSLAADATVDSQHACAASVLARSAMQVPLLGAAGMVRVRQVAAGRHSQRWAAARTVPRALFGSGVGAATGYGSAPAVTVRGLGASRRALPVAVGLAEGVNGARDLGGEEVAGGDGSGGAGAGVAGEQAGGGPLGADGLSGGLVVGAGQAHPGGKHAGQSSLGSMFGGMASSLFG